MHVCNQRNTSNRKNMQKCKGNVPNKWIQSVTNSIHWPNSQDSSSSESIWNISRLWLPSGSIWRWENIPKRESNQLRLPFPRKKVRYTKVERKTNRFKTKNFRLRKVNQEKCNLKVWMNVLAPNDFGLVRQIPTSCKSRGIYEGLSTRNFRRRFLGCSRRIFLSHFRTSAKETLEPHMPNFDSATVRLLWVVRIAVRHMRLLTAKSTRFPISLATNLSAHAVTNACCKFRTFTVVPVVLYAQFWH